MHSTLICILILNNNDENEYNLYICREYNVKSISNNINEHELFK